MTNDVIECHNKNIAFLEQWFQSALGVDLLHYFIKTLHKTSYPLVGETRLQLGNLGRLNFHSVAYKHNWVVSPHLLLRDVNASVVGSFAKLPLANASIDCLISPLIIDCLRPFDLLIDEMDRVLSPMGHIVFFGLNRCSLWNFWFQFLAGKPEDTLDIKTISSYSLYKTMRKRGYVRQHFSTIKTCKFPLLPGFYCLIVQKIDANIISPNRSSYFSKLQAPSLMMASYSHFEKDYGKIAASYLVKTE